MSPEMLLQPFEQTFHFVNGYCLTQHNTMLETDAENSYYLGYQPPMDPNEDFRTAFYNPFEIKHRKRTTRAQLKVLEKSFEDNPKPNATVRRLLAQQLDMTPRGVQIWFQNRRAKAKLQRKKSGQAEEDESSQQDQPQSSNSPALFNQFFHNLKAWDRSMRSANITSPYMLHTYPMKDSSDWLKSPLHPLASVIESDHPFTVPSSGFIQDEWRRKSCPSLIPRHQLYEDRRLTADNLNFHHGSILNTTDTRNHAYSLNCSPLSQELTPILSTGSPVSFADGAYYDPCLNLLLTESSPTPSTAI